MAELFNLDPLFPGCSEIDQIHRICSICGSPTSDPNADNKGSMQSIRSVSMVRELIMAGGHWQEGLKLALNMKFKFPPLDPVPLFKIIPGATVEALQMISITMLFDPHRRPSADELLTASWFDDCKNNSGNITVRKINKIEPIFQVAKEEGMPIKKEISYLLEMENEPKKAAATGLTVSNSKPQNKTLNINISAKQNKESLGLNLESWGSLQGISYHPKPNNSIDSTNGKPQAVLSYMAPDSKGKSSYNQQQVLPKIGGAILSRMPENNSIRDGNFPFRQPFQEYLSQPKYADPTLISITRKISNPAPYLNISKGQLVQAYKPHMRIEPISHPPIRDPSSEKLFIMKRNPSERPPEPSQKRGFFDFFKKDPGIYLCF